MGKAEEQDSTKKPDKDSESKPATPKEQGETFTQRGVEVQK